MGARLCLPFVEIRILRPIDIGSIERWRQFTWPSNAHSAEVNPQTPRKSGCGTTGVLQTEINSRRAPKPRVPRSQPDR